MRKTYPVALITPGVVLFVLSITSLVALASVDDWSSIGKQVLTISVLGALSYTSL